MERRQRKKSKNSLPERSVERLLMDGLRSAGYLVIKSDAGAASRYTRRSTKHEIPAGFPDLIALKPNAFPIFIEVKRAGGKLRPAQEVYLAHLRSMGYKVYEVYGQEEAMALIGQLIAITSNSDSVLGP